MKSAVQPIHAAGVAGADRAHLDDLTVEKLDAVVLVEDPGLAHAVVLVDGEAAAGGHGHRLDVVGRARHDGKL